ncbi:MAG: SOS response-associated peptidase [Ruminococcus sp.]|nr:SOS response-associated peptidase [Ruminococcus sp.]
MCGRYYVDDETAKEIERIIRNLDKRLKAAPKYGEIYPTNNAMVVQSDDGQSILSNMSWGFPQYQRKGVIFNARSETALEKRTFSSSAKQRRCIIPARGFYEWDKDKNKIAFERPNKQAMLLAGIWNTYGLDERFVILTTDANESMQNIHDRMPLIIEPSEIDNWLHDDNSVEFLLHKRPGELLIAEGSVQQTLDLQ